MGHLSSSASLCTLEVYGLENSAINHMFVYKHNEGNKKMARAALMTSTENNTTDIRGGGEPWMTRLIGAIDDFRDASQNITGNQMVILLMIARKPLLTQAEIVKATGLSDATVSRICAVLSDRGLGTQKGCDLIEIRNIPGDYRIRGQILTHKGRRLIDKLREAMKRSDAEWTRIARHQNGQE